MSQYFVRFVYTWTGADAGTGSWRATEMDVARASELPDSAQQLLARRWTALVRSCAIKLGRVESNLPAYTSSSSVSKQLAALGTDRAATLLEYAEKVEAAGAPGALSAEESEFLQRSIAEALASPLVLNQNGARAVRSSPSLPSLLRVVLTLSSLSLCVGARLHQILVWQRQELHAKVCGAATEAGHRRCCSGGGETSPTARQGGGTRARPHHIWIRAAAGRQRGCDDRS